MLLRLLSTKVNFRGVRIRGYDKAVKGAFLDFLNMLSENSEWLNLDILDQMYGIIDRFELFPQYGAAKSMIIEPVTSDFYLFFILFMSHEFFLPELLERNIDDINHIFNHFYIIA